MASSSAAFVPAFKSCESSSSNISDVDDTADNTAGENEAEEEEEDDDDDDDDAAAAGRPRSLDCRCKVASFAEPPASGWPFFTILDICCVLFCRKRKN